MRHMSNDSKKKRICFVATYTYALFHHDNGSLPITGLDVQLYNWATAFSRDGEYEVHFVVGDFGQQKKEIIDGVTLWKSMRPKKRGVLESLFVFFSVFRLLKKVDADIYIDRGASGPISFELALFCKFFGRRYLHMVAHDSDVDGGYMKKHKILGIFHYFALKMADFISFQNEYQRKFLQGFFHNVGKIKNSFPIPIDSERKGSSMLWIGSTYAFKRPMLFLDFAKSFPSEKFTMIIRVHDKKFFSNIKDAAAPIKNIEIIPDVSFFDIDRYLLAAKFLINTSEAEGFPNIFIQSAINGVPILSLEVNPDGFLEKGGFGKSFDGDFFAMCSFLGNALSNRLFFMKMSDAAKNGASTFDIEKNIGEFKDILKEI